MKYIWPFKWIEDERRGVKSFRECYQQHLKKKGKYDNKQKTKELAKGFFEGGGYEFLINMELTYEDCGSICNVPLFYIQRDISKGIPKKECLTAAIEWADVKAKEIGERLGWLYLVVISSSGLPLFLLCGYNKTLDKMEKEAEEEE